MYKRQTIGATDADFFGNTISPAGITPNAQKVEALMKIPMPEDLKQLRFLLRGLSYYRKFLRDMAKRIRPITSLRKQGVKFVFTPAMEAIGRELLVELSSPPFLVYPNWDGVTDNFHPFVLYCDASVDGFGATLEQERDDHTIHPIMFVSRATIESERHWTPLDLEAGRIFWESNAFEVTCWVPVSDFFRITRRSKASTRLQHNPRVQRWLEFLTTYN